MMPKYSATVITITTAKPIEDKHLGTMLPYLEHIYGRLLMPNVVVDPSVTPSIVLTDEVIEYGSKE
jgi:F0F1-type ATP synthase delta subunit